MMQNFSPFDLNPDLSVADASQRERNRATIRRAMKATDALLNATSELPLSLPFQPVEKLPFPAHDFPSPLSFARSSGSATTTTARSSYDNPSPSDSSTYSTVTTGSSSEDDDEESHHQVHRSVPMPMSLAMMNLTPSLSLSLRDTANPTQFSTVPMYPDNHGYFGFGAAPSAPLVPQYQSVEVTGPVHGIPQVPSPVQAPASVSMPVPVPAPAPAPSAVPRPYSHSPNMASASHAPRSTRLAEQQATLAAAAASSEKSRSSSRNVRVGAVKEMREHSATLSSTTPSSSGASLGLGTTRTRSQQQHHQQQLHHSSVSDDNETEIGDEDSTPDSKRRRLARKAELARLSRQYKKNRMAELEDEVAQLREQLEAARQEQRAALGVPQVKIDHIQQMLQQVVNTVVPALALISTQTHIPVSIPTAEAALAMATGVQQLVEMQSAGQPTQLVHECDTPASTGRTSGRSYP